MARTGTLYATPIPPHLTWNLIADARRCVGRVCLDAGRDIRLHRAFLHQSTLPSGVSLHHHRRHPRRCHRLLLHGLRLGQNTHPVPVSSQEFKGVVLQTRDLLCPIHRLVRIPPFPWSRSLSLFLSFCCP